MKKSETLTLESLREAMLGEVPVRARHGAFLEPYALPGIDQVLGAVIANGAGRPEIKLSKFGLPSREVPAQKSNSMLTRVPVDPVLLTAHLLDGWSLVIDGLHEIEPTVGAINTDLSNNFDIKASSNCFVSLTATEAFGAHSDTHAVVVYQCEGRKQWTLWDVNDDPTEFYLEQGEILYIPRGTMHAAKATDGLSVHVTVSIDPPTMEQYIDQRFPDWKTEFSSRRAFRVGENAPDPQALVQTFLSEIGSESIVGALKTGTMDPREISKLTSAMRLSRATSKTPERSIF